MMDPVEKFRQIKIHHHLISGLKMLLCLGDRSVGAAVRAEAMTAGMKRRFEDRLQDLEKRSAFGIGGDHSPLSSPPRSSFCCAEDQEGLGHRDVEPAPYREGFICSPTRMDRLGTSWHESAYRWPTAIALRCLRHTGA